MYHCLLRPGLSRLLGTLLTGTLLTGTSALASPPPAPGRADPSLPNASSAAASPAQNDLFSSGPLDEPLLPWTPKQPRSEVQQDQIEAAARFAHGRLLLQRDEHGQALRSYQRAWRRHPEAVSILREIVPLAIQLKRPAEAARYAVLTAEQDAQQPPLLLMRLAMHLAQQEEWARALKLYEKTLALYAAEQPQARNAATVLLHMELGRLYFLTEDFPKAADSFAVVAEALEHPDRFSLTEPAREQLVDDAHRTYTLMAESFLKAARLDQAAAMFEKADAAQPNPALLALQRARVEAERGNRQTALEQLQQYLDAQQTTAGLQPYQLLARLLTEDAEDPQQARRELRTRLETLRQDDPANAPLGYFLAEQLLAAEQLEEAEQLYRELLQLEPASEAYEGLIAIYRQGGQTDKLLRILGQVAAETATLQAVEEHAEAIASDAALLEQLIQTARQQKQQPEMPEAGVPLALALLAAKAGQFDTAEELFQWAREAPAGFRPEMLVPWGLEMLLAEQYPRAAQVFQLVIDENVAPENAAAFYFYLAGALEIDGQTEPALEAAGKAAQLNPQSARLQSRLPWILYHAGRFDEAETKYLALLEQFDSHHDSTEVREVLRDARMVLSNLCVQQQRLAEAEEWLEQVLDEFPEDIGAMNDLGYLWADQNKHLHLALRLVQKAVEAEPENRAYLDSLGWAYYRLGRYPEAVIELEKAAATEKPDGVVLDHLGDAYLQTGQLEKALQAWKRAAEAFEKEDDQQKLEATRTKIQSQGAM